MKVAVSRTCDEEYNLESFHANAQLINYSSSILTCQVTDELLHVMRNIEYTVAQVQSYVFVAVWQVVAPNGLFAAISAKAGTDPYMILLPWEQKLGVIFVVSCPVATQRPREVRMH